MNIRIALAGNPNSGKTTLFNALTGSNQFVGNWPGVTVEKKEGKLKKHDDVTVTDLPGIYSLSPYTLEEVVARNYLIEERPDAILDIVDGSNLERNLYLTTQLTELGIPVVVAINMMDIVKKNGDKINTEELSRQLGCKIVEISALKGTGVAEAAEAAVAAARGAKTVPMHTFSGTVEHALAHIEEASVHGLPEEQQRWYAIKIFERDDKVLEKLKIPADTMAHIENDIKAAEEEYFSGNVGSLEIIRTRFVNTMSFRPETIQVLPCELESAEQPSEGMHVETLFEPDAETILAEVMPMMIADIVYSAWMESTTSEQGSRRMAMKTATDNADELGSELLLEYNKARQAAITQEITEIVGGSEAV